MRKNQGMTLIGMLLVMSAVVIAGVLMMRVIPVYLQHYTITQSIKALEKIPSTELSIAPAANVGILKDRLEKQLYINSIEMPRDRLRIVPGEKGNYQVVIKYQVIKPLVANISLLFNFDEQHEVNLK